MGVSFSEIIEREPISIEGLSGKRLVVDTYNMLYQFLSNIRLRDGALLTDSKGNVTSHLNGLFARTTSLMQKGVRLIFVFDGEAPKLKSLERERRHLQKLAAEAKYTAAAERGNLEEMKKYASRTSRLTKEMAEEAKKLVAALGHPIVQAPSEGEAQAAFIVANGDAFAEVSEDYDCLLFGVPRLIKNLSITGRKKVASKFIFQKTTPELIDLKKNLSALGISQEQLIVLAMLIGTDYNRKGIPGLGQKKGLKLVKKYGNDFDRLFQDAKWDSHYDFSWREVFDLITNMKVETSYELKQGCFDKGAVLKLLCDEHDFSKERVALTLEKLGEETCKKEQKGLSEFF